MKISTLVLIAASTFAASSVFAYDDIQQVGSLSTGHMYVGVNGGAAFSPGFNHQSSFIKYDTGYVVDGSLGYAFANHLRLEANVGYLSNQVSNTGPVDVNLGATTVLANVYYDIPTGVIFPYVGAGLGLAHLTGSATESDTTVSQDTNVFAYQGIVGLGAHVSQHVTLDVQYRRLQGAGNDKVTQYHNNLAELGLSYAF